MSEFPDFTKELADLQRRLAVVDATTEATVPEFVPCPSCPTTIACERVGCRHTTVGE